MTPRIAALTVLALVAFAANSLLCRAALQDGLVDAGTFTGVRLASGALTLWGLVALRGGRPTGEWTAAGALFAYAIAFSVAYLRLGAGTGALILFGTVQATMFGAAVAAGQRPPALVWAGLATALAGLVLLVLPGLAAPDPIGAALMAGAGAAWGVYTLRGRGASDPLAITAGNFARTVPLAVLPLAAGLSTGAASAAGLALAVASGALASGVGYSLWYAAVPSLGTTRAALVQLSVPALAALGGVLFLEESVTVRLAGASVLILGGIAVAIRGNAR